MKHFSRYFGEEGFEVKQTRVVKCTKTEEVVTPFLIQQEEERTQ